ncbi:MAG: DUF4384 domain-containing protein [candidate division KSB1 bacterium]|nr:DUF4384 domain-containing protein [candidate division KSB1 bacterium]MDZ7275191.1 DUF4384 domain-containing protein [candidate division KSB1 bacterium]MDZ7287360.1 DUF4384 domain-containing protein [candidate division KSB1 bacterium]MDZ7299474.1 DUF4384 domain-containing protein [candidate division KSB1 bacterium]MDZ7305480.1 DUF4384 domain-containing protein [candidate division KSB1 bacterium]
MKKFILLLVMAALLPAGQRVEAHHPPTARVEVWSTHGGGDWDDAEAYFEVFLRVSDHGYVTVYQIDPYGRVEILYPLAHHHQRLLRPNRVYCLGDLADDIWLDYGDCAGQVQIGVIFTPEPVYLAPWLTRSFCEAGLIIGPVQVVYRQYDFPRIFARVEADLRLHLGPRCAPAFLVTPIAVRPRMVYRGRPSHHHRPAPLPPMKKRENDRRGYWTPPREERDWRGSPAEAPPDRHPTVAQRDDAGHSVDTMARAAKDSRQSRRQPRHEIKTVAARPIPDEHDTPAPRQARRAVKRD